MTDTTTVELEHALASAAAVAPSFGDLPLDRQRPGACHDSQRPIRTRGARSLLQLRQGGGSDLRLAGPSRRFDELG